MIHELALPPKDLDNLWILITSSNAGEACNKSPLMMHHLVFLTKSLDDIRTPPSEEEKEKLNDEIQAIVPKGESAKDAQEALRKRQLTSDLWLKGHDITPQGFRASVDTLTWRCDDRYLATLKVVLWEIFVSQSNSLQMQNIMDLVILLKLGKWFNHKMDECTPPENDNYGFEEEEEEEDKVVQMPKAHKPEAEAAKVGDL